MDKVTRQKKIIQFLINNPIIKRSELCRAAGLLEANLSAAINGGGRGIPEKKLIAMEKELCALESELAKYGFKK